MKLGHPKLNYVTRTIHDATLIESLLIRVVQIGSRISAQWGYRGFGACCRFLQKLVPARFLTLMLEKDTAFAFPLADGYWSMLLGGAEVYEPEIENFLRGCAGEKYTLIDCGANYGYWSTLASGLSFGGQRVIAIEPSPTTFAILERNAALNGNRFTCIRKAVGPHAGAVYLSGNKHEARTVSPVAGAAAESVEMFALDSLLDDGIVHADEKLVIKLDVEGLEIGALSGSSRLLAGDCIVICEDHGSDRSHTVSRHILEKTPLRLFHYDVELLRFEPIIDVATLDHVKRFRNRGYNVFATASSYWDERLRAQSNTIADPAGQNQMSNRRKLTSLIASLSKGHLLTSL